MCGPDLYQSLQRIFNFQILRISDGAIIIGKIDASGSLEVIDETLNQELIVLERIN